MEAAVADYDETMVGALQREYYGDSGFFNFGYWTAETRSQREASENLVNRLLEWIPRKQGTILDVACGLGATTRMLLSHYPAKSVYALNYSLKQVGIARTRLPESGFVSMDAACLGFANQSFDNVICVEAAFHFNTRHDFLREALRVLKPGGRLVFSDILMANPRRRPGNYLRDPGELAGALRSAGFEDVEVVDATRECWEGFRNNVKRWPGQERKAGRVGLSRYVMLSAFSAAIRAQYSRKVAFYTLARGSKPA